MCVLVVLMSLCSFCQSQSVCDDTLGAGKYRENGIHAYKQGDFAQAIELLECALSLYEERGEIQVQGRALALDYLGRCKRALYLTEEAVRCHLAALEIWKTIDTEPWYEPACRMELNQCGGELVDAGISTCSQARYRRAEDYFRAALLAFEATENGRGQAVALYHLGICCEKLARFTDAENYYGQSVALYRSFNDKPAVGRCLIHLARCKNVTGRPKDGLAYAEKAVSEFAGIDLWGYIESLCALGECYSALGDYQEALNCHVAGLSLLEENGCVDKPYVTLECYWLKAAHEVGLAETLEKLGQFGAAINELEHALWLLSGFTRRTELHGRCMRGMGRCLAELGEYPDARVYFNEALKIWGYFLAGYCPWEHVRTLLCQGRCYLTQGELKAGEQHLKEALDLASESNYVEGEIRVLHSMGLLALQTADLESALEAFSIALRLANTAKMDDLVWRARWGLARVRQLAGQISEAQRLYAAAANELEAVRSDIVMETPRQWFDSSTRKLYEEYVQLLHETKDPWSCLLLAERCRARTFLELLHGASVQHFSDVAEEGIRTGVVEVSVIEADLAEVVANLPEDTAALEYFVTDGGTYVWVIKGGHVEGPVQLPYGRAELMNKVIECRTQLDVGNVVVNWNLTELYDWLIRPVENLLPKTTGEGDVPHLIIIPSGPLYYLPFQALIWTSEDLTENTPFIVRYAISYSPSLTTLKYAQGIKDNAYPQATFLGLADPDSGDSSIPRLPDAQTEARMVARLFPHATVYVDSDATEDVVQSDSATAREILLSTHGLFNPHNPMYSYLVVSPTVRNSDGKLYAHEVFTLPLHANMVVLSACETLLPSLEDMKGQIKAVRGADDDTPVKLTDDQLEELTAGDEVVGLTRAFISAGSSSVLSSLWSVPSGSTSQLMVSFYKHIEDDGMDKAQALRAAQLEVMNTIGCTQPYFWAAFNLMGDWK